MCPTYDWQCDCGFNEAEFGMMNGPRLRECPICKKRSLVRLIGCGIGFVSSSGYKDQSGDPIYFKEPYFDTAMRRSFSSAREKSEFMHEHGIVSAGDSDMKAKREKKEHHEHKMDTKKEK